MLQSMIERSPECEPTEADDRIPTLGVHRGIGLHDNQPPARIEIVKAEIDRVARTADIMELAAFAANSMMAPEARTFAASKIEISYQMAAEGRQIRPAIDLDRIRASVAGLDSLVWRDPERYGSLLDAGDAVPRAQPA
jgi:hypothetical protein